MQICGITAITLRALSRPREAISRWVVVGSSCGLDAALASAATTANISRRPALPPACRSSTAGWWSSKMSRALRSVDRWWQSAKRQALRPIMRSLSPRSVWWRKPIERRAPRASTPLIPRNLRPNSERKVGSVRDGLGSRERLPAARRGEHRHGFCPEDHIERVARHPLQQAGAQPVQCAPREGRRLDRRAGWRYRPWHPPAKPQLPAGALV